MSSLDFTQTESKQGQEYSSDDAISNYLNTNHSAKESLTNLEKNTSKSKSKEEDDEEITSAVSATDSGAEAPQYYEGWRLAVVQMSLNLILFIAALDITIVVSAVEKISEEFHDYSKSAWIITGFSLPNAVCCLVWSRLSQKLGKKMSVTLAVIVFEIGSLIVAVSSSMNMLIGGRVISGIAGSGVQTLMYVVGVTLVPEEKRAMVLSLLSLSFTVSSVLGPFIGGVFTNAASGSVLSWRWCFYINLPIGFASLAVFTFIYDDNESSLTRTFKYWRRNFSRNVKKMCQEKRVWIQLGLELLVSFDMFGFLCSAAGYVLTLLAFTFSSSDGYSWSSGMVLAFLVLGVGLIFFSFVYEYFFYHQVVNFLEAKVDQMNRNSSDKDLVIDFDFSTAAPLFPKVAISNFYIGCANATSFFVLLAYGCQATYVIQYFQLVFHNSALKASIHFIPFMITISIVCLGCAFFITKTGQLKPFIIASGVTAVLGNVLLATLDGSSNQAQKIIYLVIASSAFGFVSQPSLLSAQKQLDENDPQYMSDFVGITAVNYFCQTLGIAAGSVVSTMIFDLSIINKAKNSTPSVILNANNIVSYVNSHFEGPNSQLSILVSKSIHNVFYFSTGIAFISLVLSVFCSNKKFITSKEIQKEMEEQEDQSTNA